MTKIKNSNILIVGPGSTILKYKKEINKFIKKERPIIIGLNYIGDIIIPHYHVWGDVRRFKKFGKFMSKNSIAVFPFPRFPSTLIKEIWGGKYKKLKYRNSKYMNNKDFYKRKTSKIKPLIKSYKIKYEKGYIYGRFRAIGCLAILWVYIKKAKKINIIGMDGYTLFEKDKYDKGICQQHWYKFNSKKYNILYQKTGYTDIDTFYEKNESKKFIEKEEKKEDKKKFYEFCLKKDEDIYNNLKQIKEFGVKFKILTPTVYKEFYKPFFEENE